METVSCVIIFSTELSQKFLSHPSTEDHYSNTPSNRPYSLQQQPQSRAPLVATNGSNGNGNGNLTEEVWLRQSEGRSSGESQSASKIFCLGLVLSFVNVFCIFLTTELNEILRKMKHSNLLVPINCENSRTSPIAFNAPATIWKRHAASLADEVYDLPPASSARCTTTARSADERKLQRKQLPDTNHPRDQSAAVRDATTANTSPPPAAILRQQRRF